MAAIGVFFQGFSSDESLRELAVRTGAMPCGEFSELHGEDAEPLYQVILQILDATVEEAEALEVGVQWLMQHAATIEDLTTRRHLEIQTVLELNEGCRMFYIPPEAMRILVDRDCTLIHQSIRELDPRDIRKLTGID